MNTKEGCLFQLTVAKIEIKYLDWDFSWYCVGVTVVARIYALLNIELDELHVPYSLAKLWSML